VSEIGGWDYKSNLLKSQILVVLSDEKAPFYIPFKRKALFVFRRLLEKVLFLEQKKVDPVAAGTASTGCQNVFA